MKHSPIKIHNAKSSWPWIGGANTPGRVDTNYPKISIVTPSYNQGQFLEETIRSVVMQGYPNLEYIVIDGGSSDNSIEIIKKYSKSISYWVSEPDRGQTHALNKGFALATGDIFAYINSDDIYLPYTFQLVSNIFTSFPRFEWITGFHTRIVDNGVISPKVRKTYFFSQELYRIGFHNNQFFGWNQQVSTFWTKNLFDQVGRFFDESFDHAMDIDMWIRMSKYAPLVSIEAALAAMRLHPEQKSRKLRKATDEVERKSREYGFWPIQLRNLVYPLLSMPGIRSVMRRTLLKGKADLLVWNPVTGNWNLQNKHVF
jgi:glycosyltransferase involved in cell wall biosynthesis